MHYAISPPSTTYSYDPFKVISPPQPQASEPSPWSDTRSITSSFQSTSAHLSSTTYTPQISSAPTSFSKHSTSHGRSTPSTSSQCGLRDPSLNPIITYNPNCPCALNLLYPITDALMRMSQSQYVTNPAIPHIFLRFPGIPLSCEVMNVRGVTAADVLIKLRDYLSQPLSGGELGGCDGRTQGFLTQNSSARGRRFPGTFRGTLRLDYVFPRLKFIGLSSASDGSNRWDVNLLPA